MRTFFFAITYGMHMLFHAIICSIVRYSLW